MTDFDVRYSSLRRAIIEREFAPLCLACRVPFPPIWFEVRCVLLTTSVISTIVKTDTESSRTD